MKVNYVLTMDDVVVNGQRIDQIVMDWETDDEPQKILEDSQARITAQNFLTKRMVGLDRVGESLLTITPMKPMED